MCVKCVHAWGMGECGLCVPVCMVRRVEETRILTRRAHM